MANGITHLWQEQPRHKAYRIQTTDSAVVQKLRRRKTMELVGYGINTYLYIFRGRYSTRQKAKLSLQRLTGQKVKKDAVTGGFVAVTYLILNPKSKS